MGFWSWLTKSPSGGESPNANPASSVGPGYRPGDQRQVMLEPLGPPVVNRGLPVIAPSPWSGWPAEWSTAFDSYGARLGALVDVAWDAIDLNTRILSSMPVYRLKASQALPPVSWMTMPAPGLYTSWAEFIKQLFWDFQMGEAFVLALARNSQGYPAALAVVPPYLVDHRDGAYLLKNMSDVQQEDLLHIRYACRPGQWRGIGPLEVAGARVTAAGLLSRYQADYLESGGIPRYTIETDRPMNPQQIQQAKEEWAASRGGASPSDPAFLTGGAKLNTVQQPSPKDVTLLELEQFNEARICVKLGVPPFLLALPSGADPMTYQNVTQIFDFHNRASLRPMMNTVMTAISNWALPSGQSVELNGDEYTRPPLDQRVTAYQTLFNMVDPATGQRALSIDEIRAMERFGADDDADISAVSALTGGDQ
jgi:HK97 family phage portal protein